MLAVIFEVWPASGRKDDYLAMAAALRAEVEQIDGFISVERFERLYAEGKLLSLQFWRDEEAITAWRNHLEHRRAQALGRDGMFADYRLRIAEVVRDYGPKDRDAGAGRLGSCASGLTVDGLSASSGHSSTSSSRMNVTIRLTR